ncbi:MAG: hypothetical protein ABSG94_07920 [Brevinematales bacterium]|jgi:hypothetical protein
MKGKTVLFFAGIALSLACMEGFSATYASGKDLQLYSWGDGLRKVKQVEGSRLVLLDETRQDMGIRLRYKYNYAGYPCTLVFFFSNNDKLYSTSLVFQNSVANSAEYEAMIKKLSGMLRRDFGRPSAEKGGTSQALDWTFKKTEISLSYYKIDSNGYLNLASIDYSELKK